MPWKAPPAWVARCKKRKPLSQIKEKAGSYPQYYGPASQETAVGFALNKHSAFQELTFYPARILVRDGWLWLHFENQVNKHRPELAIRLDVIQQLAKMEASHHA